MNGMVTGLPHVVADETRSQIAALCWRMHRGHAQILLITSRDTGRWVVPKGWPMPSLCQAAAAEREAWEEAGVKGRVAQDAIGFYAYDKVMPRQVALPCMVAVFPLRVSALADRFPERKQRRRKWFDADKAARKVAEPELRTLILAVADNPAMLETALHA